MNPQERTEGQPERPAIKVKLGEPFSVSSHLDSIIRQMETFQDEGKEEIIPVASVNLEIEDIGKGRVTFLKDFSIIEKPPAGPLRTPAGPVELRYIIDNGKPKFEKSSSPLLIRVDIDRLTAEQLETLGCELIFENEHFEGLPNYDKVELRKEGTADLHFDDYDWIDPKTQEEYTLIFPPNKPEIFDHMQFLIKQKK